MNTEYIDHIVTTTYPFLGCSTGSGVIVLFREESAGMVVYAGNSDYSVGDYGTTWAMDKFAPIKGAVKLTNY